MKGSTKYWFGIRHVGEKAMPDTIQELEARLIARMMVEAIQATTLAKQLVFVIARSESEIVERLNSKPAGASQASQSFDNVDAMWAELEAQEN